MGRLTKKKIDMIVRLRSEGYTQGEVAEKTGVCLRTVRKYDPGSTSGVAAPQKTGGLKQEFVEFKQKMNLDQEKAEFNEEINTRLAELEDVHRFITSKNVSSDRWEQGREELYSQLNFVLDKIDKISSREELTELREIKDEIIKAASPLIDEHRARAEKRIRDEQAQEVRLSRELLQAALNTPFFPPSVRKKVISLLLVRNDEEADKVCEAMSHYCAVKIPLEVKVGESLPFWQGFTERLERERWGYINELYWENKSWQQRLRYGLPLPPQYSISV